MSFWQKKIPRLTEILWKFQDDETATKLFEILMFSELRSLNSVDILDLDVKITGKLEDSPNTTEVQVKGMIINPEHSELIITSANEDKYFVSLNDSIAQFAEKFWDEA